MTGLLALFLLVGIGAWSYRSENASRTELLTTPALSPSPPQPASTPTTPLASAGSPSAVSTTNSIAAPDQPGDPTSGMPVLSSSETPDPDHPGTLKRIRVVKARFKYPLWRIEEVVTSAAVAGMPETMRSRKIMIADHAMVRLNDSADLPQLEAFVKSRGLTVRKAMKMPGCYLVGTTEATLEALPRLLAVLNTDKTLIRYAEPDYVVNTQQTPDDPQFSSLWGLNNTFVPSADISAPELWDLATGDTQVVVAVIDTGIDYTHPDLVANIWTNTAETADGIDTDGNGFIDDVRGWNFSGDNNNPMDGHSHGTHVSGTIGAAGNNGIGVVGVNWNCRIIPIKFLDDSGSGTDSDAADALHYLADLRRRGVNIRLTSNSWGGGDYSATLRSAIQENAALGILFIAAAGNSSANNDTSVFYPASYGESNIIVVASTDSGDGLSYFSNYGATSVHLGAPGSAITSTTPGSQYGAKSGTSMATPHVSGVALLLWNTWPGVSSTDIRNALLKGVDAIPSLAGKTITGGRLNGVKALNALFRIIHTPAGNAFNNGSDYPITAEIGPGVLVDTNSLFLYWALESDTNYTASPFALLSNTLYQATIPQQPEGTTLRYWLTASSINGLNAKSPVDAPTNTYSFRIVSPISLTVTGTPVNAGTVTPEYGLHDFPSGKVFIASAPASSLITNGERWACTGWAGSGSVPATGSTNTVTFTLTNASTLVWQWRHEFALAHTCTVSTALSLTTWWPEGSTACTLTAMPTRLLRNTNFCFTGWTVDGLRQPDPTNTAANPVTGILMTAPHQAEAHYLPDFQDSDLNGLNDWWESLYFGSIGINPDGDPDSDGFSNRSELSDGTDPRNPASIPTPPVVLHAPLADPQSHPAPFTVSAVITDNYQIVSAVLAWTRNGGAQITNAMSAGASNTYLATLPAPVTNGEIIVYRIIARDGLAATTNGPHTFGVSYPVVCPSPQRFDAIMLPESTSNLTLIATNTGSGNWAATLSILWGGLSNDVEHGAAEWTHGGTEDLWTLSTNRSTSGSTAWYCGNPVTRVYGSSMHAKLDSPPVYLPTGARLSFRYWIKCELDGQFWRSGWLPNSCWDGGIVELSTNNGSSFVQISPVGGYPNLISGYTASPWPDHTPCFAGTGGWARAEFDLAAFTGKTALIRFHFGSDDNTEEEGWYLDDIAVTPVCTPQPWLTLTATSLTAEAHGILSTAIVALSSAGIPTGSRDAALKISGNTPTNPVALIPVNMRVCSPAIFTWLSAGQTATNGTGWVTLSNRLWDVDGDTCQAAFEWRASPDSPWSNTWIIAVQSGIGTATVNGITLPQLSNLTTRTAACTATNTIISTWDSFSAGTGVLCSTNLEVRSRVWDGIYWSEWTTSQPFMVDNECPATPAHLSTLWQTPGAWSLNATMDLRWDTVVESRGSGVRGYQYGFTTNPAVLPQTGFTTARTASGPSLPDGTNHWAWVRAADRAGNLGPPTLYGPCWIDAERPSTNQAVVSVAYSPFGPYVIGTTGVTGFWSGFDDGAGSGIAGYYYARTNAGGTAKGTWTPTAQGVLNALLTDQTNSLYVWAKDNVGWIGPAAKTTFLVLSPAADWDHDGTPNDQEEIAGSDASQASSGFRLSSEPGTASQPGHFRLQWSGLSNRHYTVYYRDSLLPTNTWLALPGAENLPGTQGTMTITDDAITGPIRFYRITVNYP